MRNHGVEVVVGGPIRELASVYPREAVKQKAASWNRCTRQLQGSEQGKQNSIFESTARMSKKSLL